MAIDIRSIFEKVLSENLDRKAMIDSVLSKYGKYQRSRGSEPRPDEEGRPVKPITSRDNYFSAFCAIRGDLIGPERLIAEFAAAKKKDESKRRWNRIDARRYQELLKRFMDGRTVSVRAVTEQLDRICECALDLIALETIAVGLTDSDQEEAYVETALMYDCSLDDLIGAFGSAFGDGGMDLERAGRLAEELLEWAAFSDHKSTSDYGPLYLISILATTPVSPTAAEAVVALNRCVDVTHASNDLASAFVKGGAAALDTIRYGNGAKKRTWNYISGEMTDNSVLQEILTEYSAHVGKCLKEYGLNRKSGRNRAKEVVVGFLENWADPDIAGKAASDPDLEARIENAAEETFSCLQDIFETDIEYASNDVKDVLVDLLWIKERARGRK